jgi:hypothetical protein
MVDQIRRVWIGRFLCLAITEISKIDASAAVIMSVNNSLVCAGLEKYCNEEQNKISCSLAKEK